MITDERHENFDKTDRKYSLAPTDDLVRFWRSKGNVTAGCPSCERRISCTTGTISMKLNGNNSQLLPMSWLDFEGQGHSRLSI